MEPDENIQQDGEAITSFTTRAVNVFTSPGELFTEMASAPVQRSSWLIPYLLMVVMVGLVVYSITNNPALYDGIMREQSAEMQKRVDAGDMTQAQADRAADFMNPTMFLAVGILGGAIAMTAVMFLVPLILWGLSKGILHYAGGYKKMLEVYGITNVVAVAGTLVSLIMMNLLNSAYAQPGGAFFIRDIYDKDNFMHNVMASMNVFTIWQIAVIGLGISAVSGKKAANGLAVSFGVWAVWVVIASFLGWGAR
ncbi:MAG TPA: YIP1 family protein [Bacteroidota bacterium]|nr:YIP1 family protein [Bacteroidota bacterium]